MKLLPTIYQCQNCSRCAWEWMRDSSRHHKGCSESRTEAAQKEGSEIIAGLNRHTFYLRAGGQFTPGRIGQSCLLEFQAGPPFWSGDSCKPAAHSIPIRRRVPLKDCWYGRKRLPLHFALWNDSQSWIPDDKNWIKNVKQMVTFPKINLFTNKKSSPFVIRDRGDLHAPISRLRWGWM